MINLCIDYLSVLNYKGQFLCSFPLVNLAARQLSPSQSHVEKSPYPRDKPDYLLLVSRWDYMSESSRVWNRVQVYLIGSSIWNGDSSQQTVIWLIIFTTQKKKWSLFSGNHAVTLSCPSLPDTGIWWVIRVHAYIHICIHTYIHNVVPNCQESQAFWTCFW